MPFMLGSEPFMVQPFGWGRYGVCLQHIAGRVGLTDSAHLPGLRFQPRAEFLHGVGTTATIAWFQETFDRVVAPLRVGVPRVDLFADWQGWVPRADDRLNFVTRARRRVTHEESEQLTGFEFGRRKTGLTARIYDKTADIAKKRTEYWYEIWDPSRDPSEPVWRVEFEFGRRVLDQFGIDSPEEAVSGSSDLWKYATESWLSLRAPGSDTTRSRWATDARWQQVANATLSTVPLGLERITALTVESSLAWWAPRLVGALSACGALLDAKDLARTLAAVPRVVAHEEARTGVTFNERLARRRAARLS